MIVLVCLSSCLSICLSICKQHNSMLSTDWDEILWRGPGWCKEELIKFWWRSGSSEMSKCENYDNDPEAFGVNLTSRPYIH